MITSHLLTQVSGIVVLLRSFFSFLDGTEPGQTQHLGLGTACVLFTFAKHIMPIADKPFRARNWQHAELLKERVMLRAS